MIKECLCHHCKFTRKCKKPRVDCSTYKAELNLTAIQYKIFEYLNRNKGIILTHNQIIEHVWKVDKMVTNHGLCTAIWRLNKKVNNVIKSKNGLGYYIEK
jgi:DNA-binding response OmpR family regulator